MDNNIPQNTELNSDRNQSTQPIQNPTLPVAQIKTNSPKTLSIVISTALAFGVMGYFLGAYMPLTFLQPKTGITPDIGVIPSEPGIISESPQATPYIPVSVTPTNAEINPMFNTTIYSNKEYGFSFNYPSDWKLTKSPSTYLNLILTPANQTQEFLPPIQISIDSSMDANGQPNKFISIQEAEIYYTNLISKESLIKKNINVANKVAVNLSGVSSDVDGPGVGLKQNYTLIQLEKKVLLIQLNDQTLQNDLSTILGTFSLI